MQDYRNEIALMGEKARHAARFLRNKSTADKNALLKEIAESLIAHKEEIIAANSIDVADARGSGLKESMIERLALTGQRFDEMVNGLLHVITLEDPVGAVDGMWLNEAGLSIGSKRVPLGVIAMIYESRPNVTIDAAALCIKTGNAVILKGGSDALVTNQALTKAVSKAIAKLNYPEGVVQLVNTTDREFTKQLLSAKSAIDCVIPRGGAGLIQFVVEHSKVPMIETGIGNCHIFIDEEYDMESAIRIVENAKVQRPGACNAVETVLVHRENVKVLLPMLMKLAESGVTFALCSESQSIVEASGAKISWVPATEDDWWAEYLDYKLAVKIVEDIHEAIQHIDHYSSGHSEAILTNRYDHSKQFLDEVDSAAVYVNASTRFSDGGEFGFGAEIGISTQKLHARGPMGLKALTTNKYIVYGNGQIRK